MFFFPFRNLLSSRSRGPVTARENSILAFQHENCNPELDGTGIRKSKERERERVCECVCESVCVCLIVGVCGGVSG